ncbi:MULTISPECIES: hypothetical protein [Hymenobacter]|uniref:Uncharacterized protein n=2 Tax=Hymenobacter TaxID=89966 RepID=A0ABS6X005_9BACT|nr:MULTISPECIES: hypothetical protein [Hymenobacter]MBO3272389.1 hypothetical protein [Hymenobacter defluvii]MBW3129098.1 hypothetical protein [Hymenobacter profundi]
MKKHAFSFLLAAASALLPLAPATAQTTTSNHTQSKAETELRNFSAWVNQQVDKADASARRNWPSLKSNFDRQSQRLDRATDSLSTQSKREYAQQKTRYQEWAAEQQRLEAQATQPTTAQQAQRRLLNEDVQISKARGSEMVDLYSRFIDATRAQRRQWTDAEWAEASTVLSALNARYSQVRSEIAMEDRLRIRSWQGEFRTFEKARSMKDIVTDDK